MKRCQASRWAGTGGGRVNCCRDQGHLGRHHETEITAHGCETSLVWVHAYGVPDVTYGVRVLRWDAYFWSMVKE